MSILSLAVLLFLAPAPVQQSGVNLEVGVKLRKKDVKKSDPYTMTHPAQVRPFVERDVGGVLYRLAYNEKSREVRYIFTEDKDFKTAGGLKVGDIIEVSRGEMEAYLGWEVRAPKTSDGWHPLIGFNDKITVEAADWDNTVDFNNLKEGVKVRAKILGFVKGGQ